MVRRLILLLCFVAAASLLSAQPAALTLKDRSAIYGGFHLYLLRP